MSHSGDDVSIENNSELQKEYHFVDDVYVKKESDGQKESNSDDDVSTGSTFERKKTCHSVHDDSVERINECQGAVRSDVGVSAERGSDRQKECHSRDDVPTEITREGQTKGHLGDDVSITSQRPKKEVNDYGTVDKKAARHLRKKINVYFYTVGKTGKCSLHPFVIFRYGIQILKMIVVTYQVLQFGQSRNEFHYVVNRGHIALRHLLLEDWDASWETPLYPPAHGEFASYDIDDLSERINQSVYKYSHIENLTLGTFTRVEGKMMNATLELYHFDSGFETEKITFPVLRGEFDFIEELENRSHDNARTRMATLTLDFALQAVRVMEGDNTPNLQTKGIFEGEITAICLYTDGKISYENKANGGQVIIGMKTTSKRVKCQEKQIGGTGLGLKENKGHVKQTTEGRTALFELAAVLGIVSSLISLIINIILAAVGAHICLNTKQFMKNNFHAFYKPANPEKETDLPWKEYLHFFRYWTVILIVGDALMFITSVSLVNSVEEYDLGHLDTLAILLGTCTVFQWCSILPLFVIYHKFAMLLRTIYRAFVNVIKYVSCAMVIFYGFCLCGLLVLGPYHPKFITISKAAETLFAIIQGDEIYATLHLVDEVQMLESSAYVLLWYFTRCYLYACIGILSLVVLNIILAIVLDTYKASLEHYNEEKNKRVGSLENAMCRILATSNDSPLRNAIIQIMSTNAANSVDEQLLRDHIRKFCRVTDDDRNIETVIPRTIKAFLDEADEDKGKSRDCNGIECVYADFGFCSMFRDQ